MTEPLRIEVDDQAVLEALARAAEAAEDMTPLMSVIEGILVDATERAFENQADPSDGTPWAALSPVTRSRRADPNGPILKDSGALVNSVSGSHDSNSAAVGVGEIYGITHQLGAAKGQYSNGDSKGPIPWGDIPARPFLGVGEDDKEEILNAVSTYIRRQF